MERLMNLRISGFEDLRIYSLRGPNLGCKRVRMKQSLAFAGALLLIAASAPLSAHHSFAAEFDANKPVVLTGAVTKIEWTNPHIWVYLDVKDDRGVAQPWQCEG